MTFYLHSTFVTSSLAWLISWLPLLLVISSCVWILSGAVVESTNEEWPQLFDPLASPILIMMPGATQKGRHTRPFIASMILILSLAAGLSLGYGVRDHQLVTNTREYFGVTVLSQQNDHSYTVKIPGYSPEYPWEFCHPLKMPARVVDIKYEQRFGCKVVNGTGFVQPHEERKNELQTGRHNPTAAEPAAWTRLEAGR